jgi:hypothetical protein
MIKVKDTDVPQTLYVVNTRSPNIINKIINGVQHWDGYSYDEIEHYDPETNSIGKYYRYSVYGHELDNVFTTEAEAITKANKLLQDLIKKQEDELALLKSSQIVFNTIG